jgi:hypothetical protein
MDVSNRLTVPFSEVPRETSFYDVNNREFMKVSEKEALLQGTDEVFRLEPDESVVVPGTPAKSKVLREFGLEDFIVVDGMTNSALIDDKGEVIRFNSLVEAHQAAEEEAQFPEIYKRIE